LNVVVAMSRVLPYLNTCYCVFSCAHRGESIHPYCEQVKTGDLRTECTQQRDAVALCNLIDYRTSLPAQYQVSLVTFLLMNKETSVKYD